MWGLIQNGTMGACYATGTVAAGTGGNSAGGLVGDGMMVASITACYATGDAEVTGNSFVGGLVGGIAITVR